MVVKYAVRPTSFSVPVCEPMEPRLLLAGDITVTVDPLATADTTPTLTGTISDSLATLKVRVDGVNHDAVNNHDGTWSLDGSAFTVPLANGTYDVLVLATNSASGTFGVDETADELVVDTVAPIVSVNELVTNALRPALSGAVNDPLAAVSVTVGGHTYTATNNKNGTWTLAANVMAVPANGVYDVAVTATDADGHVGADSTTGELTIDRVKPVVAVNALTTGVRSPKLTGTVDDHEATLSLSVNGQVYSPVNNGDGTWTLAAGTIAALAPATYDVTVAALDKAGNSATDATTNELVVRTLPGVTVNPLATTDTTPELTGSVSDPAAAVSVTVGGQTLAAINNGDGSWTLANDALAALDEGIYDVAASATLGGLTGVDATTYELVVDATAPAVTVDALTTAKTAPTLTGAVDEADAVVTVTVNGKEYAATNNGDGTWRLSGATLTALTPGTYDVAVSAEDAAGNVGTDATTGELGILPVVTVTSRSTTDTSPALAGTVTSTTATISVRVDGVDYDAVNNANGTWTLADDALPPLAEGTYDVIVTATLGALTATDATTNELAVDATAPAVTIKAQAPTTATRPAITGTVSEAGAVVTVTVGGKSYAAVNNGDGTWTIAADTITALAAGTYTVSATAKDAAGNSGAATGSIQIVVLPAVKVNALSTTDRTPRLTGTVSSTTVAVTVTVNNVTYAAVNNGDGTWSLADDTVASLSDGTYDVTATATVTADLKSTDATTGELVIDTTVPVVTVTSQETADTTPDLAGTVTEPGAVVTVTLNGKEFAATNNGNGTWSLAGSKLSALTPGVYNVAVSAKDAAGNVGADATSGELGILPAVTVASLSTGDTTPRLSGTVSSTTAAVSVLVNGVTYPAVNNTDGTWTLADGTVAALPEGTYDVVATATLGTLVGTDATTNELTVDATAPALTIQAQDPTTSKRPAFSGTVGEAAATVGIAIAGKTYLATNNGDGSWTLPANTVSTLAVGTYTVTATAKDAVGNKTTATTTIEIVTLPLIQVTSLSTTDRTPALTGMVDNASAAITVTVNGVTYPAVNNGDGTWTLADNTVASLADGTYDVVATATLTADLKSTDLTLNELVVDTKAPTVTVTVQETADTTPDVAGTVSESGASVTLVINGKTYTATVSGTRWTLAGTLLSTLKPGAYDVKATAKDAAGNTGADTTSNELAIIPVVTVDTLSTNDSSPQLTGTVTASSATIKVEVDGSEYAAVNNGDGFWTLAKGLVGPLFDGVYEVLVTATLGGMTATDSSVNELVIDTTAPGLTVKSQDPTTSTSPGISGTVGDEKAAVTVEVAHKTYSASNFTDGTWGLAAGTIAALAAGTYTVTATVKDAAGNTATASTSLQIVVLPTIGVDSLSTTDLTPALSGSVSDPAVPVTVTVNGVDYTAVNNGNGSWTLADNTLPSLAQGSYEVIATATVSADLTSTATGQLTIDRTAPVVTVDELETESASPTLTGTVTESGATVTVTVDGKDYTATNNGDRTWSLALAGMEPGAYDVAATAKDAAGNSASDSTTDELSVLPVVTIDSLATNDTTPALTGTVSSHAATVTVTVNGHTYAAVNNADDDNTWTLADNALAALPAGTYDVTVTATLGALTNTDATVNELVIDTTAPGVTLKPVVASTAIRPAFSGTVSDPKAAVTLTVAGKNYTAVNNADGTWSLAAETIAALAVGSHVVTVTAKDAAGNKTTATGAVEVLRVPAVTVDFLTTTYTSPQLTGTIDDTDADVYVVVNGSQYQALNNGDGTWTLEADTLTALSIGTYDVTVYGVDTQSNYGQDATLDELRVVAQTTVQLSHVGTAYLYYTDPDGTRVTIYLSDAYTPGGVEVSFESNSLITVTYKGISPVIRAATITCDAGAVLSSMYVYTNTPTINITAAGGRVSGATIGGISGSALVNTLNAKTMDLIDGGIYMPSGVIKATYLRSILDADVTMFGIVGKTISLTVSGAIVQSNINVTDGSIATFTAGSMIDSSLYVGVMGIRDDNSDGVYDLPNVAELRKGFQIATFKITGYAGAVGDLFANSNVVADKIGTASLINARLSNQPDTTGDGVFDDAHELFGLTANSIKSLQLKQGKKTYRWAKGLWPVGFDPIDLTVRIS